MNLFRLINYTEEVTDNQLFGPSPYIAYDQLEENFYHLITFSTKGLKSFEDRGVFGLAIFLEDQNEIVIDVKEIKSPLLKKNVDYPDLHEKWWDEEDKFKSKIEHGINFKLLKQSSPSLKVIKKEKADKDNWTEYVTEDFEKAVEQKSYFGGFPMWIQSDETPLDSNGEKCTFLLALDGYDKYLRYGRTEEATIYFFIGNDNQYYWVDQC